MNAGLPGGAGVAVNRYDARPAVGGAVDRDCQCRRARVAVGVGDRVGEGLGERIARLQGVDRSIGVVQPVAVAAVGTEHQGAVGAIDARAVGAGRAGCDVVARRARTGHDAGDRRGIGAQRVGAATRRDDVAGNRVRRRVFGDGVAVGPCDQRGVEDVDDQVARLRVAVVVLDQDADRIQHLAARVVLAAAARVVVVGHDAGDRVVAGDRQHAFRRIDRNVRGRAVFEGGLAHRRAGNGQRSIRIQTVRRANGEGLPSQRGVLRNTDVASHASIGIRNGQTDQIVHRRDVNRHRRRRFIDGASVVDGCVLEGCRTVPVVVWFKEQLASHDLFNRNQLGQRGICIEQPVCRQTPDDIADNDSILVAPLQIDPDRTILASEQ